MSDEKLTNDEFAENGISEDETNGYGTSDDETTGASETDDKPTENDTSIFQTHKPLINYLPLFLRNIMELKYITDAGQEQIDRLHLVINDLLYDQYIEIASETGIKRWEKLLYGILPYATGLSLEDRRIRIQEKIAERLPYTMRTLKLRLDLIIGESGYKMYITGYNLYITVYLPDRANKNTVSQLELLKTMLHRFLPANLTLKLIFEGGEYSVNAKVYLGIKNIAQRKRITLEVK